MYRDVIITIFSRVFGVLSGLITSVATANYLGVEGRGLFFIIMTASTLVIQIANLGMPASTVYYVARDDIDINKLKGNSFWISLIVGTISSVIIGLYYYSSNDIPSEIIPLLALIPIIAIPQLLFMIISNILIGQSRISLYNIVQIVYYIVMIIGYLSVIYFDAGLSGFLIASGVTSSVACGIVFYNLRDRLKGILGLDWDTFRKTLHFSFKAYTITLVGFVLLRISVFMMQSMTTVAELGLFSIATQIADTLSILPQSFAMILFPILLKDIHNSSKIMLYSTGLLAIIMALVCGATYVIAPWFIETLFGVEFSEASVSTRFMLPAVFFLSLITVQTQYLASHGYPWSCLYVWIIGLIIAVIAGFKYIPLYDAIGGAITLSIGYFSVLIGFTFLTYFTVRRHKKGLSHV